MGNLNGKRALVTAGGQGIGLAITKQLLRVGCDVCVHYFSSEVDTEALLEECCIREDQKLIVFQGDLCEQNEAEALVAYAVGELGGLEILINNAGSLVERRYLEEIDAALYSKVMDLNVASMAWVTRAAASPLKAANGASIVNFVSCSSRGYKISWSNAPDHSDTSHSQRAPAKSAELQPHPDGPFLL